MAELRTSFCVLEDASNKAGMPLHKIAEGDAISSKNALPAMVAKFNDSGTDKFRYLTVDSTGAVLVTQAPTVSELYGDGTHVGDKDNYQIIAEITLTAESDYKNLHLWCSCFRDANFKLEHDNDSTPAVLVESIRVGPGQFSFSGIMKQCNFSAGATGTQKLVLKGKNLEAASQMSGTIGIDEAV